MATKRGTTGTARKRGATKRGTGKRAGAKRGGAKRAGAKRAGTKRASAKRGAAKRSTAKRSTAKRSTAKRSNTKRAAARRELIEPRAGEKRYVRRAAGGEFTGSQDDVGRSLRQDVKRRAKKSVRAGQGDKGDQRRRPSRSKSAAK